MASGPKRSSKSN